MDITLAIDCAVSKGTIALFRDSGVVASTAATDESPSRAEEILGVVQKLLSNADTEVSEITRIIVSTGPGSYSGIRIGIATALGLKNALGVQCLGVSVLEALVSHAGLSGNVIAAIPVGKKDVAWPELSSETDFVESLRPEFTLVAHSELLNRLGETLPPGIKVVDAGTAVAEWIGRMSFAASGDSNLSPVYLRNKSHAGNRF